MDKKQKIISISILIAGMIALVVGVVFLVMKLNETPEISDGRYLVDAGEWMMEYECEGEDCGRVIWKFTELGKGTLTTNKHENDYDFKWSLRDDKLDVRTNWLYELDNNYDYRLNRDEKSLTISADGKEYRFTASQ
ncbi:hypothetical protein IKE99_01540 [Candidatus Saccharibacteria bacterium]|nr:hypothetical protein [Candidatus Saccharibacteria bacterium]